MSVLFQTILLLAASNVFMTIAWYGHLKHLNERPWLMAALVSWGIALFEYLLQVPANRIGHTQYSMGQLKILQEVVSLSIFVPIAFYVLKEPLRWDYLWAALCILGAVFFVFRGQGANPEIPPAPPALIAPIATTPANDTRNAP
jgi:uncharacterized protein (DUF486 family)